MMGEVVWLDCFEMGTDYFYGTTDQCISVSKHVAGNKKVQFVSLNVQDKLSLSLANYFYLQKQQLPMPKKFLDLEKIIGDVNETYYFDQVEVILERIQAKKYKQRRPSIFFESLVLSNTVSTEVKEEVQPQIKLPMIEEDTKAIIFPKENKEQTIEKRAYVKRKVYERLLEQLSFTDFSYIRK